ncbi:MarR family winged helix-turn-helix transcriptional regulator [Streptomyces sp. NPDC093595]|uniref:MarR family winged helix-turn-helix transcriptional regulator n=1 Tax=Streptomyces sp. NPDC093595 TaxID=3366045 RepID=UPI00380D7D39
MNTSLLSEESPLLALQRATHVTLRLLAAKLASLDLTASEVNALAILADGRERTISELLVASGSRPTTLTTVLDRLERRCLVIRHGRPGDRRVVVVELTDSGKVASETIRHTMSELEQCALSDISSERIADFYAVLHALVKEPT